MARLLPAALAALLGRAASLRLSARGLDEVSLLSVQARLGHAEDVLSTGTADKHREMQETLKASGSAAGDREYYVRDLIIAEMYARYANRPPPEQWEELLHHALRTPADPCDAEVLSTYGWNGGFGSGVNILMSEIAAAAYFNRTVAQCFPPNTDWESFQDLWNADSPLRLCDRPELCNDTRQYAIDPGSKRSPWGFPAVFWAGCLNPLECELNSTAMSPWLKPAERHPGIFPEWRHWSRRFRHFVYEKVFVLSDHLEAQRHGWMQDRRPEGPYIGVHLRGTDKWGEAPPVNIPAFVEQIQVLANRTGLNTVFLASDDWERTVELDRQLRAVAPQINLTYKPKDHYERGIHRHGGHNLDWVEKMVFLGELELLRNSTAFLGTASSNVGRLVYFLREPEEGDQDLTTISVDEHNDFFSRLC